MDTSQDKLMTTAEAAEYVGLAAPTLETWRVRGGGPPFVRLSRKAVRYRRSAVDRWLADRVATTTTEADAADRKRRSTRRGA